METIFKEIAHTMHNDYAGWKDKLGWDQPDHFLQKLQTLKENGLLTNETFNDLVKEYLLDFEDKHIHFIDLTAREAETKDRGFRVRRYNDRLYITEVHAEGRLGKGMAIKSLGGYSIPELRERHFRLLKENHGEREDWRPILLLYDYGEVEDMQGVIKKIQLSFYEKDHYEPVYSVKRLTDNTLLMTLTDFMDPDSIKKMIEDNQSLIDSAENWIIDVRVNYGGSDSSYYRLLPYLMPVEGVELADQEDVMLFNCTYSNAERQLATIAEQIKETQDEQALVFLRAWLREWERNKGEGFVQFDFEEFLPDTFVNGTINPKAVVVLTDVYCGSSGDSFVEVCKKSNKVTVLGRATMGLNDYANLAVQKWEKGYELWYPTSRLSRIDKGLGMTGRGIEPHVYIPWTPQHLEEDVDLKAALGLLESNVKMID